MEHVIACIYQTEEGEYKATEKYGFKDYDFPNKGVGFEFSPGEEIMIEEVIEQADRIIAHKFYKVVEEYELAFHENGYTYQIFRVKKAGDVVLEKEEVLFDEEDLPTFPPPIRLQLLLTNKKRKQKEIELTGVYEQVLFSLQNNDTLHEIKDEFSAYHVQFYIESEEPPYLTIEKDGVQKKFALNWEEDYHRRVLIDNRMNVPIALAEQQLREVNAHDLIATDIKILLEGDVIVIHGVKYYFKKKKDKDRLKELNPLLYEKICRVMAGKALKDKDPSELKRKYKEFEVLTEEGELEEYYEEAIDPLKVRSFQKYLERMIASSIDGPVYAYKMDEQEILFYVGDEQNLTPSAFQAIAKEILAEKIKENQEFGGWDGAETSFITEFVKKNKQKTIDLGPKIEDDI